MSVCPFCKAPVAMPQAPCPRCGKLAAEHPSIAAIAGRTLGNDFDDDEDEVPDLEIASGSSAGGRATGQEQAGMAYEGGKGLTLDDDLFGDGEAGGPLELDVPVKPPPRSSPGPVAPPSAPHGPSSGAGPAAAAPSSPDLAPPPADAAPAPPPPPPPPTPQDQAARRIANFPPCPAKLWEAPRYAVRVFWRRIELRQDLASLKKRRSPDVALYERALTTYDARMFTIGLAITCGALFVATVLFFMPVIKRFAFAPD